MQDPRWFYLLSFSHPSQPQAKVHGQTSQFDFANPNSDKQCEEKPNASNLSRKSASVSPSWKVLAQVAFSFAPETTLAKNCWFPIPAVLLIPQPGSCKMLFKSSSVLNISLTKCFSWTFRPFSIQITRARPCTGLAPCTGSGSRSS